MLPELQNKRQRLKALIISDINNDHANLMKDILDYNFINKLQIDINKEHSIDKDHLVTLNYDLIITNFPVPHCANINVVCIDSFPSDNDFAVIHTLMVKIKGTKY